MESSSILLPRSNPVTNLAQQFAGWFSSDSRHYQIAFLSFFLVYGLAALHWELDPAFIVITFFSCLLSQAIFVALTNGDYRSLKSALISSLSLCLMLRTNEAWVGVIAAFLSIASKFIFRREKKHFFNPTNFGISATILFTHQAWISPGQWGNSALLVFAIGVLGLAVLVKVKRLDTAIAFLITFCLLSFIRNVLLLGWGLDYFIHQFSSGTLLLFSFFMITDPVSTPSHSYARILWATLVACLASYLTAYQFVNGAPLWALFILSPSTVLFDKFFVHAKFQWK